jgi:hypothetical protein
VVLVTIVAPPGSLTLVWRLPSGSRVVIDPSALTTELLAAAPAGVAPQAGASLTPGTSAGVAPHAGASLTPGTSAGTPASGSVVLPPGVAGPSLGSGATDVNPGGGSADSCGTIVLGLSLICVAETSGAVVAVTVVSSGGGALTETVPSG